MWAGNQGEPPPEGAVWGWPAPRVLPRAHSIARGGSAQAAHPLLPSHPHPDTHLGAPLLPQLGWRGHGHGSGPSDRGHVASHHWIGSTPLTARLPDWHPEGREGEEGGAQAGAVQRAQAAGEAEAAAEGEGRTCVPAAARGPLTAHRRHRSCDHYNNPGAVGAGPPPAPHTAAPHRWMTAAGPCPVAVAPDTAAAPGQTGGCYWVPDESPAGARRPLTRARSRGPGFPTNRIGGVGRAAAPGNRPAAWARNHHERACHRRGGAAAGFPAAGAAGRAPGRCSFWGSSLDGGGAIGDRHTDDIR